MSNTPKRMSSSSTLMVKVDGKLVPLVPNSTDSDKKTTENSESKAK